MAKKTWDRSADGLMPQPRWKLSDATKSALRMGCTYRILGNGDAELRHPQMESTCSFGRKPTQCLPYVNSWVRKLWKLRNCPEEELPPTAAAAVQPVQPVSSPPPRRPSATGGTRQATQAKKAAPKKTPPKAQQQAVKKTESKKKPAKKK